MTTIIVGTAYTLNIEDLRNIDLKGRECINSRIDNIRQFLNVFIDDLLVHQGSFKTTVTCYYDYLTFSISLDQSYPFIKNKRPTLFKFDCDICKVTNNVLATIIDNCVIDNGDTSNQRTALSHRFMDITEAALFFKAIKVIDSTLICNDEILEKIKLHQFNPNQYQKNTLKCSLFDLECGGEIVLQAHFDFGPYHFSIYGHQIIMSCANKRFSFDVINSKLENDIVCLKDVFKLFYAQYVDEPVECAYEDFITLFKMKYI